jgi:lysophospholipase L1-like esterase
VPISEFRENLKAIAATCRAHSEKIVFVGFTPLSDSTVHFNDHIYMQDRVVAYDRVVEEMARELGIPVVSLFEEFLQQGTKALLSPDGVHSNSRGHELIARLLLPYVMVMIQAA